MLSLLAPISGDASESCRPLRLFQLDVNSRCSLPTFSRFVALGAFGFVLAHKPFRFVTGDSFEIDDAEDAWRRLTTFKRI